MNMKNTNPNQELYRKLIAELDEKKSKRKKRKNPDLHIAPILF